MLWDNDGAARDFDLAIMIDSNFVESYIGRGFAAYGQRILRDAPHDFYTAINITNNTTAGYNNDESNIHLSGHKGTFKNYNRKVELNTNYLEETVSNDFSRMIRENVMYQINLMDYMTYFNKAIEINNKSIWAYNERAYTKQKLSDYKRALKDYDKALELSPSSAETYLNRGAAKATFRDLRGAIKDYAKAVEIKPKLAEAFISIGAVKNKLSDFRGAIQAYDNAIAINPNRAYVYFLRAFAKRSIGDKDGACLDWSKAGELGTSEAYDYIKKYCN